MIKAASGWYTFRVAITATKADINRAVTEKYQVTVTSLRTQIMHGKNRRVGKKLRQLMKSDWKKALVRLKDGQKIAAFEVTSQDGK